MLRMNIISPWTYSLTADNFFLLETLLREDEDQIYIETAGTVTIDKNHGTSPVI